MKKLFILLLCVFLWWQATASTNGELESANILWEQGIIVLQENPADYRLDDTITRKEFMKVVANIVWESLPETCNFRFSDVVDDWGCKYIEWALERSFIAENTTFRPDDRITKAESMKLVLQARGISRLEDSGDWRQDDMRTAYTKGIVSQEYTDYNTFATRWWIFERVATPVSTSGWWLESWDTNASSSGWGNVEIYGDDWRNKVP